MKKVYTAIILIVLLCGGVLSANYIFLQRHMNEVLKEDPRNDGISVWVYYKWFVNSSEINYDLRSVSAENSSLDVSRVMLQFAEKVKDAYNLGLIRSEVGIERGKVQNGYYIEPQKEVTRAKAAKSLYFMYVLGSDIHTENDIIAE